MKQSPVEEKRKKKMVKEKEKASAETKPIIPDFTLTPSFKLGK